MTALRGGLVTLRRAQMRAMRGTTAIEDALARITVPALVLKADAPAEVGAAGQRAAGVMKNGRFVHPEGAGHNLHHDRRARSVELLTDF
jgi:pimeloyl-ACP methyl ester carboxylesterase